MLDKIKRIKYARMKPEERYIFDIVTNVVEYYHKDFPDNKFYKHNDVLMFDYNTKNGNFWCQYDKFWKILVEKFNLNYNQAQSLVKFMVEEHLINNVRPCYGFNEMEKNIKKEIHLINEAKFLKHLIFKQVKDKLIKKEVRPTCNGANILPWVEGLNLKEITPLLSTTLEDSWKEIHLIKKEVNIISYLKEQKNLKKK